MAYSINGYITTESFKKIDVTVYQLFEWIFSSLILYPNKKLT